jgi:hypothetical protein
MSSPALTTTPFDLELIAQRVLKLSEIATLEHLEALARSQAEGLMELAEEAGFASFSLEYGFDRNGM